MHPTNGESMLLSVHQEEPDSSEDSQEQSGNVSEDELDMILATMGTTSLKDSEMALLQDEVDSPELVEEEKESIGKEKTETKEAETVKVEEEKIKKKPKPENAAKRVVKKFFRRLKNAK